MDYEPRERIGKVTEAGMLLVASGIWILSFIPLVNYITLPVGWFIFWLWFKICGASLDKSWKLNLTSALVMLVPFIGGILSGFPVVIYRAIRAVQKEDEAYNDEMEDEITANRRARYEYAMDQQLAYEEALYRQQEAYEEETEQGQSAEGIQKRKVLEEEDTSTPIGQNAYLVVKNKQNKTPEEERLLPEADKVYKTGILSLGSRANPLAVAAYELYRKEAVESRQMRRQEAQPAPKSK
jgi:hypothetical protein